MLNIQQILKQFNGKNYTVKIIDKTNPSNPTEEEVYGVIIPKTLRKYTIDGLVDTWQGSFLCMNELPSNMFLHLINGSLTYSMDVEYSFFNQGKNRVLNNVNHACYRLKRVKNAG